MKRYETPVVEIDVFNVLDIQTADQLYSNIGEAGSDYNDDDIF